MPPLQLNPLLLISFYPELEKYDEQLRFGVFRTEDEEKMLKGLTTLLEWLHANYRTTLARIASLTAHGEITFDLLYSILVPRSILVTRHGSTGELRCLRLLKAEPAGSVYRLSCEGVEMADSAKDETNDDYPDEGSNEWKDHRAFGKYGLRIYMYKFAGTQKINELSAYPITYHPDPEGLKAALIKRGRNWASLNGVHHVSYHGIAGRRTDDDDYLRYNVSVKNFYHTPAHSDWYHRLKVNSRRMVDRGSSS